MESKEELIEVQLFGGRRFRIRRRWLFVGDPRDKQSEPGFGGLGNLHTDARCAIDGGRYAHNQCGHFDGSTIRTVSAQVEAFAPVDLLI